MSDSSRRGKKRKQEERGRPVLTVHFGDLHIGGTTALCPPETRTDDGGTYHASKAQLWYWECWRRMWRDVSELKRKLRCKVLAVSGGDEAEGDHHSTTQIWFSSSADQQRAIRQAYDIAFPVVDEWVFVRSTEAHDGPLSAGTELRAEALARAGWNVRMNGELFSYWIWTGVVGGVRFQVKHQPGTSSRVPHTQDASASRQAQYMWDDYCKDWIEPPDVAVWHHNHYRAKGWHNHSFCYMCPAWQLPTAWALSRQSSPRVERPGGVAFLCEDGHWRPFEFSGNYLENVRRAVEAAEQVRGLGMVPFVPHLTALWQMMSPHAEYDYWLPMDLAWLDRCDAVLRLPGWSKGADMEMAYALRIGKPVVDSIQELLNWAVTA